MSGGTSAHRDVCPTTLLRCAHPTLCRLAHCAGDPGQRPIGEDGLTHAELYQLRVVEQQAARLAVAGKDRA